jgi:enamine deaminase RidA (YjgF/YER057c/UK114 family)
LAEKLVWIIIGSGLKMTKIASRIKELGIELPNAAAPAANYVPYILSGNQVFIAGQIPFWNGELTGLGKLGSNLSIEEGAKIARICGLNLLAQLEVACDGDLDRVSRVIKLGGFVSCIDSFAEQPEVVNGASDLMVEVFGDIGRHARFAVGVGSLPRGVAVEVDGVFELYK